MVKKVLIVDDEIDFCETVKKILELRGEFKVTVCTDGIEGIDLADKTIPDIVLLDIIMPKISGMEIASRLKNNERTKEIPVIFLTGIVSPFSDRKNKQHENGGYYVAKPTRMDDLIALINNLTHK